MAQQGLSYRAIVHQTGHHYRTIKRWLAQPVPALPEEMPAELRNEAEHPAPRQRQIRKVQRRHQVHHLAQQGLSYSAIARQVGLHRVTVKQWLQQAPPPVASNEPARPEQATDSFPPPAPWSSWAEVRQVREALQEHRFLLLRRPEHLQPEEQAHIAALLASAIGPQLQVARTFLIDWYRLWRDEDGQRRTWAEAQVRFEAWRTNPTYQIVPQLRRLQEQMTPTKFERLSQFLRHPDWEATNNGVERAGRAFRHRQAPHFNFRSADAIENAITVAAFQQKAAALDLTPSQANGIDARPKTTQRGCLDHLQTSITHSQSYCCSIARKVTEIKEWSGKVTVRQGKHDHYREVPPTVGVRKALAAYLDEEHPDKDNPEAPYGWDRGTG